MAAVLHGPGDLRIEEVPVPSPGPGEVLVEIRSVGICGSDVHYYEHGRIGDFVVSAPMVLGHEAGGVVAGTGPRVAVEPGVPCWRCEQCRARASNPCPACRFFAPPPLAGALARAARVN